MNKHHTTEHLVGFKLSVVKYGKIIGYKLYEKDKDENNITNSDIINKRNKEK